MSLGDAIATAGRFDVAQVERLYGQFPYPYSAVHALPAWVPVWLGRRLVRPRGQRYVKWLRSLIGPERMSRSRLLDAGCGTGEIAVNCAYSDRWASVTAVDQTPASLELARSLAKRHSVEIDFRQADLTQPGSLAGEQPFDVILSLGVLHHLPDPAAGLQHLAELLADDGVILIYVYAYQARGAFRRGMELLRLLGGVDGPEDAGLLEELGLLQPRARGFRRWLLRLMNVSLEAAELSRAIDDFSMPFQCAFTLSEFEELLTGAGLEVCDRRDGVFSNDLGRLPHVSRRSAGLGASERLRLEELIANPGRFMVAARKSKPEA